jgi:bifunctional UDP-N-acetylglucosamine pyrophosphorylase/glucosamine-1-phosphate N-acetyltransferase
MQAWLLPAGRPETCWPLTVERDLADCVAANQTLRELQLAELAAAGLALAPTPPETGLFLAGQAWVPAAELAALAGAGQGGGLADRTGRPLAWIGSAEPPTAPLPPSPGGLALHYPWDFLALNERLLARLTASHCAGEVHPLVQVDGVLVVGERSRVLPGVYIEGTVLIGRDCKIGPNCYLRGPTAIGDGCHIGQAVEIKASILMAGAAVGHLSYAGDSIIGAKTNFGAGTITANFRHDGRNHRSMVGGELVDTGRRKFGAIIGDDVHTGIHTAIYPGRKLWPHASTRPGQVVQHDLLS